MPTLEADNVQGHTRRELSWKGLCTQCLKFPHYAALPAAHGASWWVHANAGLIFKAKIQDTMISGKKNQGYLLSSLTNVVLFE